jgi:hypothetical protein
LSPEGFSGAFLEGEAKDGIHDSFKPLEQISGEEGRILARMVSVTPKSFVNFSADAAQGTELTAQLDLLLHCQLDCLCHQLVVIFGTGQRGCIRGTSSSAENRHQRLRDEIALLVYPNEGIRSIGETQVSDDAGRVGIRWFAFHFFSRERTGGGDDGWQSEGNFLVMGGSAVPDLQGDAGKVNIFVLIFVQNSRLLRVEVTQFVGDFFAEKGFVRADDFLILLKAMEEALAQADDPFHSFGWQEGIDQKSCRAFDRCGQRAPPVG